MLNRVKAVSSEMIAPLDNRLRTVVVTTAEQLAQARAVRSICFMEERGLTYADEFDGNDYQATHFLMYAGEEPIGTSRVRWFAEFAKIERTAFRKEYRSTRTLRRYSKFVFGHVAQKGYAKLVTLSLQQYAQLWEREFGFTRVPGRTSQRPGDDRIYYELVKHLDVPEDAISVSTDPRIMVRVEGAWDVPAGMG